MTLTLEFDPFFENFNLADNIWTVSATALIFHMSNPSDKTPLWVPCYWPVTSEFGLLFESTLTLLITFQQWVPEFLYFTWIFLLLLWNLLTLKFDILKKNIIHNKIIKIRTFVLHMSISCDKIFVLVSSICPCDLGHIWNWPLSGAFMFHKHILFDKK